VFRDEADDGLRVVVHRAEHIDEAKKSHQHELITPEAATLLQYLIDIQDLSHFYFFLGKTFELH
jgi:hypothetical protein